MGVILRNRYAVLGHEMVVCKNSSEASRSYEMVLMQLAFPKVCRYHERRFLKFQFLSGGHLMRAFIERYNSPPVHNLITFGSPHMGIADIPTCGPRDIFCRMARNALKNGVYSSWAQNNIVPVSQC